MLPAAPGSAAPQDGIAAIWKQTQVVGPYTYLEFQRSDSAQLIDVQLTRSEHEQLASRMPFAAGTPVWLRPTRVTEFVEAGAGI